MPVAPSAGSQTVSVSESGTIASGQVVASDVDGTVASYATSGIAASGEGSLSFSTDGSFSYDPNGDFDALSSGESSTVTFTYTAKDDDGLASSTATVTIVVTGKGADAAPRACRQTVSVSESGTQTGQVVAIDADGTVASRAEERRVGSECRPRWWTDH